MSRPTCEILQGDCRATMATLPERYFHCCVTSPPYFGLRNYGVEGQIGLEPTPDEFVAAMLDVFGEVWRVLRDDGVAWLNLGDSYCSTDKWGGGGKNNGKHVKADDGSVPSWAVRNRRPHFDGTKPKDLIGIPWRVAFALQADGWYLRDAIIWHKPAPMPGSQRDRCTSAYEFIFQLTKRARYFFDLDAIKEPLRDSSIGRLSQDVASQAGSLRGNGGAKTNGAMKAVGSFKGSSFTKGKTAAIHDDLGQGERCEQSLSTPRNVWRMASSGFSEAHFATFPIELPARCIKASTSAKGCCAKCGAPWERITERTKLRRERPNELTKRTGENGTGNHCANTVAGVESVTLGWQPTCDCGDLDVEPCRVLDPFNGAGTTGLACRRLGVSYVGCELNPEYIEMTKRRLNAEANRGSTHKPVKPLPGQAELFA